MSQYDATLVRVNAANWKAAPNQAFMRDISDTRLSGEPIYRSDIEMARDYLDKKMDRQDRIGRTGASRVCLHASKISLSNKGKDFENNFTNGHSL